MSRVSHSLFRFIAVLALLFLLTAVFTFPLIFRIKSGTPGVSRFTETLDVLWYFWWLKYAKVHRLPSGSCAFTAYPFGLDFSRLISYPAFTWVSGWLAYFTDEIFTYNLWVILSFILSGIAMYGLVNYLTGSALAAMFSALAFAFCPYHLARVEQHLGLAQIQWMPFFIFALIKLKEKTSIKTLSVAVLALSAVVAFDYYYAFFMAVVAAAFWLFSLATNQHPFKVFIMLVAVFALSFLLTLPLNWQLLYANSPLSAGGVVRDFSDLFKQSARPLSYFLPAAENPFLGGLARSLIGSPYYGESFTEHALYLGWVPLVLSFAAVRVWLRKRASRSEERGAKIDFAIGLFTFLAVVAWLFSQPPWWRWGPIKIYMPSFFIYRLLPMFRAYCRFGIVVMLCVSVLAGFGMKFILERFKARKSRVAATLFICGLVLFEFLNFPPFRFLDLSHTPAAYAWIKGQPGDLVIAEFPLDYNGANSTYRFFQTKHGKRTINGTLEGTPANRFSRAVFQKINNNTVGYLARMQVRYVLVHATDYSKEETRAAADELKILRALAGLKLVRDFGGIEIYEVIASR